MITRTPMNIMIVSGCIVLALLFLCWLGLVIRPGSFPSYSGTRSSPRTVPLPAGLPGPVERFYHRIYGDSIPVIESAVITGRASLRIKGLTFTGRFRFIHDAGEGYRHYIEVTPFGQPMLKINEHYLHGKARLELPFGVSEGARVDQGANLALWAEAIWFPSLLAMDPRVRWSPVDAETALLTVPFGSEEQSLLVRFDPATGLLSMMESMRYKESSSEQKILWINQAFDWRSIGGAMLPATGSVTWFDEGTPWARFTVEEVVYNADVEKDIETDGL